MYDFYDIRNASHAGSWYSNKKNELKTELESYINNADINLTIQSLKAIISPLDKKSCWLSV